MAVVRISDELTNGVVHNATKLFEKRIEAARKARPELGDLLVERAFAPVLPALAATPKQFLSFVNELTLGSIGSTSYNETFATSKEFPRPRETIKIGNLTVKDAYRTTLVVEGDAGWEDVRDQLDLWKDNVASIVNERDKFVDGVKTVLRAHATLAPALKAWPPLWDLVPDNYKERHRKVVERAKPEAAAPNVDLTTLTATVVASKLVK